ncbi:hypothetical protein [Natronorubrum sp. DTA7]|uniref:hypothetical protein n=1 Tax=Natronorubrum sp. DTA7 TaxID=3447016 RepID=UPI003F864EFB
MAVLESLQSILFLLAFLLAPGVVATAMTAPISASSRIRALFRALPPTDSAGLSYALIGLAGSLPYIVGVSVAIALAGEDGIWGPPILAATTLLSVCYVVAVPIIGAVGLPQVGIDWDPTGYGLSTWTLLAVGAFWYALVFAIPLAIIGVVLSLPGGW